MTEIKLPPLPGYDGRIEGQWGAFHLGTMEAYARAAIEADRQSREPEPNNLMLSAVLRMPFEMAMADPISRMQFYQRSQQALNELEALQHSCKETSQDREDAYDIEAAAKTLAECMDYPWEPMPEKGREAMRKFAKRVIDRARRMGMGNKYS